LLAIHNLRRAAAYSHSSPPRSILRLRPWRHSQAHASHLCIIEHLRREVYVGQHLRRARLVLRRLWMPWLRLLLRLLHVLALLSGRWGRLRTIDEVLGEVRSHRSKMVLIELILGYGIIEVVSSLLLCLMLLLLLVLLLRG